MNNFFYASLLFAAALANTPASAQQHTRNAAADNTAATFESIDLGSRGYANGDDQQGGFADGDFRFQNTYEPTYGSWSGFAISNKQETDFIDYYTSQYNSCAGHGADNSAQYAVYYYSNYGRTSVLEGEAVQQKDGKPFEAVGFYVTNSAWNVNAYTEGDGMTPGAFGTGDWCKLTIYGVKDGDVRNSVEFYLADYRSDNEADHYYVADWTWVDLTELGTVDKLHFTVEGSRSNEWGATTPAYFCMDNFNDSKGAANAIDGAANATETREVARYLLNGTRISTPQRGINIIRMSDGTTRKELVK